MDINSDPDFCRAMDPDIALGKNLGPDDTVALGGSTGHSDHHGPSVAQPSDTSMATDCSLDLKHLCVVFCGDIFNRHQHRPQLQ